MNVENLAAKLVEPDFVTFVKSFDIFSALETFTNDCFDFSLLFSDFKVLHCPAIKLSKRGRRSGGVAVFVKKNLLPHITQITCKYDNMICIRISKNFVCLDKDILYVSTYIPPYQSPYYQTKDTTCSITAIEEFLINQLRHANPFYLVVSGDFNARIGEWNPLSPFDFDIFNADTMIRKSKDKNTNHFAHIFTDFCTTFDCTPLNGYNTGDLE